MFYNKTSEWTVQGANKRISRHIAKQKMKYCAECNCPGFPFCFERIFPKSKINIEQAAKMKICLKCGCTKCLKKKEQRWTFCLHCREYYISKLHCRCHSWWLMDNIQFYLPKYDSRVYDLGNKDNDHYKRNCETCHAKLFPYNMREPCNFDCHYISHEHLNSENLEEKITRNADSATKIHFCWECNWLKNYQCPFCIKKFNSMSGAEMHMKSSHSNEMKQGMLNEAKCAICEIKPEWENSSDKRGLHGLQKWILNEIRMMDATYEERIIKCERGEEESIQIKGENRSYSDVVKNVQK